MITSYDIFAGRFGDTDVRWIEPAVSLGAANKRMKEIAAEERGAYFVFDVRSRKVLASVDTTSRGVLESPL